MTKQEQVLMAASSPNLKVCILRLGGIYGIGRELTKIFSRAFGTTRPGNGEDFTNWIHLDDIVGAVDAFMSKHSIYNIVGDRPLVSRDLQGSLVLRSTIYPKCCGIRTKGKYALTTHRYRIRRLKPQVTSSFILTLCCDIGRCRCKDVAVTDLPDVAVLRLAHGF